MNKGDGQQLSSRRGLMRRAVLWALGLVGTALLYPFTRFTSHTIKPQPRQVTVTKKLEPGAFYTDRDFILFVREDGPFAVSRRCTHLGCRIGFREELNLIECPCHQSRFTPEGVRVAGPAEKNLRRFPVENQLDENGQVTGYTVTL